MFSVKDFCIDSTYTYIYYSAYTSTDSIIRYTISSGATSNYSNTLLTYPSGITVDNSSNVYVCTSYNTVVRVNTRTSVCTIIAGRSGIRAFAEGPLGTNTFDFNRVGYDQLYKIVYNSNMNVLYVGDANGIRQIDLNSPSYYVTNMVYTNEIITGLTIQSNILYYTTGGSSLVKTSPVYIHSVHLYTNPTGPTYGILPPPTPYLQGSSLSILYASSSNLWELY